MPHSVKKRRVEENLDVEESDSEPSTVAEDAEEVESVSEEMKKEIMHGEKAKKRKKRRFR